MSNIHKALQLTHLNYECPSFLCVLTYKLINRESTRLLVQTVSLSITYLISISNISVHLMFDGFVFSPHPAGLWGDVGRLLSPLPVSSPPPPDLALSSCSAPDSPPHPLPHATLPIERRQKIGWIKHNQNFHCKDWSWSRQFSAEAYPYTMAS